MMKANEEMKKASEDLMKCNEELTDAMRSLNAKLGIFKSFVKDLHQVGLVPQKWLTWLKTQIDNVS
jgi:hypothetical protein